jgi:hypothetical protein
VLPALGDIPSKTLIMLWAPFRQKIEENTCFPGTGLGADKYNLLKYEITRRCRSTITEFAKSFNARAVLERNVTAPAARTRGYNHPAETSLNATL